LTNHRSITGTAGKVDNAQVAVYLAYATGAGHGVIDRELYLPQGWIDDPARCRAAGVPDQVGFATKPELARRMLERALEAGVPAGWVTADEVYGNSPALRGWLETRQLPYVLAVKATEPLPPASGPPLVRLEPPGAHPRRRAQRMGALAAAAPQPHHWGAGLLRVRRPRRPAAGRPGPGRRGPLAGGGGVPGRQGAVWPGRPPGPQLALLVPVPSLPVLLDTG
jgi:SRSO17 transposase